MTNAASTTERDDRLRRANALIERIANCGRKFFRADGSISRFEFANRGRLYFVDKYTGHALPTWGYTATKRWRRYFTEGGTLKALVLALANDYIRRGDTIPTGMLCYPPWYSEGDPWAYGPAMDEVRTQAQALGIWKSGSAISDQEAWL